MAVFIKEGNSFIKPPPKLSSKSINEIACFLVGDPIRSHSYWGIEKKNNPISSVLLEIFTDNVIAVFTHSDMDNIDSKDIQEYIADFDYNFEYSSYNIQDILLEAIEYKSFDLEFLSRVLNFDASDKNGEYHAPKIEARLFFVNGYLVSFKFQDELNQWARNLKSLNPDIIKGYAEEAKHYWGDNYDKIYAEINLQAAAYASTSKAFTNKYIKKHKTSFGNIDFIMLLVCHYNKKITLSEFKVINHGRYKQLTSNNGNEVYLKGKFKYHFSSEGILIKAKKRYFF